MKRFMSDYLFALKWLLIIFLSFGLPIGVPIASIILSVYFKNGLWFLLLLSELFILPFSAVLIMYGRREWL